MRAPLSAKLEAKRRLDEALKQAREERGGGGAGGGKEGRWRSMGWFLKLETDKARLRRWKEVARTWYWWAARVVRRGIWWSRGERIRKIEGLYGTGVGTYFIFLRFLATLNLIIAVIK